MARPEAAFAIAASGKAATCQALEDKCLIHVRAREASAKPAADGVERPHITEFECYDSFHKAQDTGVWPQHLPFNFAMPCAK
jgi:hypothetical protein